MTWNEEELIGMTIGWYQKRFPKATITIMDNMSTDNTVSIASSKGCIIHSFDTGNKLSDEAYLSLKNNIWKNNKGWVLICDCDECLDITEKDLENETASIIRFNAYNSIKYGFGQRNVHYDKYYLFNADKIKEINYNYGCHTANPIGDISFSEKVYIAYHFGFISIERTLKRFSDYRQRLSEGNKEKGLGWHYTHSEEYLRQGYDSLLNDSIEIDYGNTNVKHQVKFEDENGNYYGTSRTN